MASWRPRTHALFGTKFNHITGAFLLAAQRLAAAGAAPPMDPAVLEETLEYVRFEPIELKTDLSKESDDPMFVYDSAGQNVAIECMSRHPASRVLLELGPPPGAAPTTISAIICFCSAERQLVVWSCDVSNADRFILEWLPGPSHEPMLMRVLASGASGASDAIKMSEVRRRLRCNYAPSYVENYGPHTRSSARRLGTPSMDVYPCILSNNTSGCLMRMYDAEP